MYAESDQVFFAEASTFRAVFRAAAAAASAEYSQANGSLVPGAPGIYDRYRNLSRRDRSMGCVNPCRHGHEVGHAYRCRAVPWMWPGQGAFSSEPAFTFHVYRMGARCAPVPAPLGLMPGRAALRWNVYAATGCRRGDADVGPDEHRHGYSRNRTEHARRNVSRVAVH